jgi:hypothetical protein
MCSIYGRVFLLLRKHKLYLKLSKCSFAQGSLEFLGHVVSLRGIATDPTKVQTVQDWPTPTCVKDVRSFLGMAGYYQKFVRHFGVISKPLTNLLKKGDSWNTGGLCNCKVVLTYSSSPGLWNFSKQFVIETGASDKGFGAVLLHEGYPLA